MTDRKMIYLDDAINTMRQHSHYDDFDRSVIDESVAMKALKDLPSAQRWIPVSEALPEDACQYIVTAKVKHVDNYPDYEVDTADFADGIFTTTNSWWGVESIIAWMPLPEAYKERREE